MTASNVIIMVFLISFLCHGTRSNKHGNIQEYPNPSKAEFREFKAFTTLAASLGVDISPHYVFVNFKYSKKKQQSWLEQDQ